MCKGLFDSADLCVESCKGLMGGLSTGSLIELATVNVPGSVYLMDGGTTSDDGGSGILSDFMDVVSEAYRTPLSGAQVQAGLTKRKRNLSKSPPDYIMSEGTD